MFKEGDRVRCVEEAPGVTVGNIYRVTSFGHSNIWPLQVINNLGEKVSYKTTVFELVEGKPSVVPYVLGGLALLYLWRRK